MDFRIYNPKEGAFYLEALDKDGDWKSVEYYPPSNQMVLYRWIISRRFKTRKEAIEFKDWMIERLNKKDPDNKYEYL